MMTIPTGLKILVCPCDSSTCPTLYADEAGRVFVQGSKINRSAHSGLTVPDHEEVVELSPELIAFLKSQ